MVGPRLVSFAIGAVLAAAPASAVTLTTYAQFFQTSNVKALSYDAQAGQSVITVAGTGTSLIGLDFLVSDPVGTVYPTTFSLSAVSTTPVTAAGLTFEQPGFAGALSFWSGTTEVLSLSFFNAIFNYAFGKPASASLIVDCFCIPSTSSDVFALPAGRKDLALAINAVTGPAWSIPLARSGGYFGEDFIANVVGTFAVVPEARTWAMLIAGFGMVGLALRRRRVAIA